MGNLLNYLQDLSARDIYQAFASLNGRITDLAESIGVGEVLFFALGLAVAVVVGLYGYSLIKLISALSFGGIGYIVGAALFGFLDARVDWLPAWGVYLVGGVLAVAFLCMAYFKFSYALYSLFAFAGCVVTQFYCGDATLALGGAVVAAMLSVFFIRWTYILTCAVTCGLLAVNCLSQILPSVELVQLKSGNWLALCCTGALALVFAVFQLFTTRKLKKAKEQPK